MRINPVNINYAKPKTNNVRFQGKHSCAKWGAALFGGAATLGAIGGSLIMTGGLSAIPLLAAYVGIGAGSGALIGHSIDKKSREFGKKV